MLHLDELITEGMVIIDEVEVVSYLGWPGRAGECPGVGALRRRDILSQPVAVLRYLLDLMIAD